MIGLKLGLGLSGGQTGLNRYRIGTSMPALILDHARNFYAELYPPVTYYTAPDYVETGYIRGNP